MRFLTVFFFISTSAIAVEVATIDAGKENSELLLTVSDPSLFGVLDKHWSGNPCKTRFNLIGSLRETFIPAACRALAIKFLLESGYRPQAQGLFFSK